MLKCKLTTGRGLLSFQHCQDRQLWLYVLHT